MGMFDSVYADCPRCGETVEFQSKKGHCCLDRYTVETAPAEVLLDVMNEPHWCVGCKSWFALIDPRYPPGKQPKPELVSAPVRDPVEGEYWTNGHNPERYRWWDANFTFDDLAQGIEAQRAETTGSVHESPVPEGNAPTPWSVRQSTGGQVMPTYRSKPIEIEAVQWHKEGDHPEVVFAKSMGGQSWMSDRWVVNGHQGYSVVNPGDWIIAEPDGKGFYPCDPDTFARKYEPAK